MGLKGFGRWQDKATGLVDWWGSGVTI